MENANGHHSPRVDEAETERRLKFADAALGAAGHEVTDPVLNELARQAAAGEISTEDALALGNAHLGTSRLVSDREAERRMAFADAALGAAGHEISDPALREIRRRVIRGELTAEEGIASAVERIDGDDS